MNFQNQNSDFGDSIMPGIRRRFDRVVDQAETKDMNWIQRKLYLYNVTFGLYMLDWWERFLFNTLVVVLLWFVFYNGVRYASELYTRRF